ncbi:MAG: HlyC/CorC family transporter [Planctomycetes bacterium]|nr:HlyC/CorC family transporter [Planctomycetota bacterium]MCP4771452.1 HlyC/CorC family transporter [Planctomycetota bacterium]MCP4861113.1 HlyC/CorC family transporter [Planctomycetota bacterium]
MIPTALLGAIEAANAAPADLPFVLPSLLLVLGATLGGLRTLLQDQGRQRLLEGLGEDTVERVEVQLEKHPSLPSAAGLARLFLLAAAIMMLVRAVDSLDSLQRWPVGLGIGLFGGLALEAFPALVLRQRARRLVLSTMPLAIVLTILLRPLTILFERALHLLGAGATENNGETLTAELIDVAADHDRDEELGESERRMIGRVIDLSDADAASTMTPRTELTAAPVGTTLHGFLQLALDEGHSRIPVYAKDLDDVRGVLYLKDLMQVQLAGGALTDEKVEDYMREPYFVPETKEVPDLLEEMRQKRIHLAVVVDEYGGTAGVVTIEDLLEEIVGEIQDEHDDSEETARIVQVNDNVLEVEGRVSIYDLNETFDSDLPEDEDYDTIAGLLFDRFGHIPTAGEHLDIDGIHIEVLEADDRRIHNVRLERRAHLDGGTAA